MIGGGAFLHVRVTTYLSGRLPSFRDCLERSVLRDRGNRSRGRRDALVAVQVHLLLELAVAVILLGAVARDVAGLAALVAALACRTERAAAGSRAIAGDVAQLATGIAFHGLRLAVAGIMVGTAALVAGCRTRAAGKASTAVASKASTTNGSAAAHGTGVLAWVTGVDLAGRVRAGSNKVTELAAVMAATGLARAAKAKSRAVGLHMAQSLAVIALLRLRSARQRAIARLVI